MTEPAHTRTVLLVDDDHVLRDMYARKFADRSIEVVTAGNAMEALERLRGGFLPDLIVFDIVMPALDGYGFLQAIKDEALAPQAAKIALTNQGQEEDRDRALALGADGYLIKANTVPSQAVEEILRIARESRQ